MNARLSSVLVLAEQPVVAALMGVLVELVGLTPVFARAGELPEETLGRVRPNLVVLLDSALDAATSDLFFARAARLKVALAVFGPRGSEHRLASIARARGIPWLELPTSIGRFSEALEQASATVWWRSGTDRRSAQVQHAPDGALIYLDREGRRWTVYDRRGGDRRRGGSDGPARRVFVSDGGESYTYLLMSGEQVQPREPTAAELERQLAEARPSE
ncbi:MAG TPA: hypothetical protein VJU87_02425 [Gemmatimonadaceae bacterium]|nr:hypothetical protein [Gemmatimonadaceae bacterium]